MSRSTFSILPYINRQKVKADGTANILCRITVDGKSAAISTGISCTPQECADAGELVFHLLLLRLDLFLVREVLPFATATD